MPPSIFESPLPTSTKPPIPTSSITTLTPLHRTLKTGERITLYPITSGPDSLPKSLLRFLSSEFSAEIQRGCTYPMEEGMTEEAFAGYWFGCFGVVALLNEGSGGGFEGGEGKGGGIEGMGEDTDWEKKCLGTFYVKPNYPGRCSHICNAGFLTTSAARGRGVGGVMGEAYLEYAPKLGYKYSVFNLVFANNTASIKIWDKLGFNVIGRVPGAARLENSEELVDALIYGRKLGDS